MTHKLIKYLVLMLLSACLDVEPPIETSKALGCESTAECPDGFSCIEGACIDPSRCGDGVVQSGEVCDDGNTVDGDYCSRDCALRTAVCGDGVLEADLDRPQRSTAAVHAAAELEQGRWSREISARRGSAN